MDTESSFPGRNSRNGDALLAAERERVVQVLSAYFAQDQLTLTEFEHRLERAYTLASADQLQSLVADLLPISAVTATQGAVTAGPVLVPSSEVPARGAILAVMGGQDRGGSWIVPRQLKVFVLMGGAEIDLREARFGPGVSEIEIVVVMGGINIIVPPG